MAVCFLAAGSGLVKLSPASSSTLRPRARRSLSRSTNVCFRRSSQAQLGVHTSRGAGLEVSSTGGGGSLGGSTGGGGDSGGDGGDDSTGEGSSGMPDGVGPLLLTLARSMESFPAIFAAALKEGKVSLSALELFLRLERNPLMRPLLNIAGFRERLMADSGFLVKLGIELGIGLICKVTAEWEKRRDGFNRELDFVFANVVMALIADFMLVWLPAPTLAFSGQAASARSAGRFQRFMRSCPDNAFQRVPAGGEAWSVLQRTGAVGRNGAKLLGVGFFASLCGVTITNLLLEVRKQIDPSFKPQNAPQNVLVTSSLYASYMASSSNLRYQIIAGVIEERGIERIFAGNAAVCGIASLLIRTANTFVGSLLWVDYLRLCGFQKKVVYDTPPASSK